MRVRLQGKGRYWGKGVVKVGTYVGAERSRFRHRPKPVLGLGAQHVSTEYKLNWTHVQLILRPDPESITKLRQKYRHRLSIYLFVSGSFIFCLCLTCITWIGSMSDSDQKVRYGKIKNQYQICCGVKVVMVIFMHSLSAQHTLMSDKNRSHFGVKQSIKQTKSEPWHSLAWSLNFTTF